MTLLDFRTEYAPYIVMAGWTTGLWQLCGRARNHFLRSIEGEKWWRMLRIIENVTVCIPLFLYLGFKAEWTLCITGLLVSLLFSLFTKAERNLTRINTPLSRIPFQFPYGARTFGIGYVILYILVGIAIAVGNANLGLVAIGAIQLLPWLFIEKKEHTVWLWQHTISIELFMKLKGRRLLFGYMLTGIIPVGVFLFLYPHLTLYVIALIALGVIGAWTLTTIKYTYYDSQVPLYVYMIFIASCVVPLGVIIMSYYFYRRSILQLKLHVNHG